MVNDLYNIKGHLASLRNVLYAQMMLANQVTHQLIGDAPDISVRGLVDNYLLSWGIAEAVDEEIERAIENLLGIIGVSSTLMVKIEDYLGGAEEVIEEIIDKELDPQ